MSETRSREDRAEKRAAEAEQQNVAAQKEVQEALRAEVNEAREAGHVPMVLPDPGPEYYTFAEAAKRTERRNQDQATLNPATYEYQMAHRGDDTTERDTLETALYDGVITGAVAPGAKPIPASGRARFATAEESVESGDAGSSRSSREARPAPVENTEPVAPVAPAPPAPRRRGNGGSE